jgi:Zn-dependent protease/CBS domain-containing protein
VQAVTLFHIRGIPVRIHPSWLAIYGLIAWTLAVGYFPSVLPDLPRATHWTGALVSALLLFVSVFLHELSHSLMALRYGIGVSSITLHVFGGVSQLEREPDQPAAEVAIAVVGPLTSFAIAGACWLAVSSLAAPDAISGAMGRYLVLVNVAVGIFNLVPGFPLDGGRILRAALWAARRDRIAATRTASRVGMGFAVLLMLLGVWRALGGEFLGGLWLVAIGFFLRQAAGLSYHQVILRGALAPHRVAEVMTRAVVSVPPGLTVEHLVDRYFWRYHVTSFPVVDGHRVVGLVSLRELDRLPRERRRTVTVREVMRPLTPDLAISPAESLWTAFERVSGNGAGRVAVVEDGRLVGYLSVKDVLHVLALAGPERDAVIARRAA